MQSEPHNHDKSICFVGEPIDEHAVDQCPETERRRAIRGEPRRRKGISTHILNACLSKDLKDNILALLQEFRDVLPGPTERCQVSTRG